MAIHTAVYHSEPRKLKVNETWNILRSRLNAFLGFSHDGSRDLYASFGYPRAISTAFLWTLYLRGGIANRIVRAFPEATWSKYPSIGDDKGDGVEKGGEEHSPFAEAVYDLCKKFKVLRYIERADRVSGVARYGILVMGFGGDLRQPVTGKAPLLYLSPYSEMNVNISKWDTNVSSPRYGLPEIYNVKGSSLIDGGESRTPTKSFDVHHSRVLHLAEHLEEDDVFGTPRLLPIVNHLMDLDKVVGGSAETFWLTANRGIALWADKEAVLTEEQTEDLKKQAEKFTHQQQRWLTGQGMQAQVLGSEDPDPGPNAEKLLDLIAGTTGIPKRILIGSERGELASGQDENAWSGVIDRRRTNYAAPCVMSPFIQRMIETGNLPEPSGEFYVEWPEMATLGPVEESTVMSNKTTALTNYARTPGVEMVVPVPEFRRDILGLPTESEFDPVGLEAPLEVDPMTGLPVEEPGNGEEDEGEDSPFANVDLRTLYIRRDVLNKHELRRWAQRQGLTIDDDLHVTVCYSRTPIDWNRAPRSAGSHMMIELGERRLDLFGQPGSKKIVLRIEAPELQSRHDMLRMAGASHDWPRYQAHISLAADNGVNINSLQPYTGAIALGPEIWEEVKE